MVSDSDLVARLREILTESDLDTATAGSVRKQLEEDFGVDLSDRKGFVRDQIDVFLETLNRENEKEEHAAESENGVLQEDDDDEEESKGEGSQTRRASKAGKQAKKRGGGFQTVCSLSPQLQKVVGESKLARTEVVKKLWVYIKEKDLQDPTNKRNIICDGLLNAIFRVKSINMFQMNKALTKHIWPLSEDDDSNHEMKCEDGDDSVSINAESAKEEEKEEEKEDDDDPVSINAESSKEEKEEENEGEQEEEEEEEEAEHKGNARKTRKKRSSKVDKDVKKVDKDVKRRGGGFNKLCSLSPQLQEFIGESELARTEVVKRLWAYIREKNLQDPKDKRNVLCDESLHALFNVNSINMFQMNKALSKHIWPLNEEDAQSDSAKMETKSKQEKEKAQSDSPKTETKSKQAKEKAQDDSAKTERKSKKARERGASEVEQKEKRQKKGASGFLAPLPLSDALVKFFATGENALSRADVVKRIWDYIKQNDLQDPSDKRKILCDEKLKELFEVDSFNGFSMTKLLTTHFIKLEQ
ncbi:hypothetical protein like AT3G19080 [Hibiscus trionum]|uniref:Uncharacterized protein n=1 Tax=Hibiscus trionum TaxID=183268 RepID=A0A9W7HBP6_HIBTR|nr:hypothetical protein like AT3G19080 [Hibiscus trionum]